MTAETVQSMTAALAERLGVEPEQMQATLSRDPFAAALAMSMMQSNDPEQNTDAAAIVRFVGSLVGACPLCLGENVGCPECDGNGKPGSRAPNETALVAWISRPLRRLGLCVGRPRRPSGDYNHEGGLG